MIGKANTGKSFTGLGKYLEHGSKDMENEKADWYYSKNLPESLDISHYSKIIQSTANQNKRTKKPVYHLSISWDKKDEINEELMQETAERVIKDINLHNNQYVVISHKDTDHKHIHIMANRVNQDSLKATSMSHDYTKIEKTLRYLEIENNLRITHGTKYTIDGIYAKQQSSDKELKKVIKDKDYSFKELATEISKPIFEDSKNWQELKENLKEKGLHLEKKGRGIILTDKKDYIKCSSIDRKYSLTNLEKNLGKYEELNQSRRVKNNLKLKTEKELGGNLDGMIREFQPKQNNKQELETTQNPNQTEKQNGQNIKTESGRSYTRTCEGDNQRPLERNNRINVSNEPRSLREFSQNQGDDHKRTGGQKREQDQNSHKNFFSSFYRRITRSNSDKLLDNWKELVGDNSITLLEEKKKDLNSYDKNFKKEISVYEWLERKKEENEIAVKKNIKQYFENDINPLKKYNRTIKRRGLKIANAIMYKNPSQYGSLKGYNILGIKTKQRRIAEEYIKNIPIKMNNLQRTEKTLKLRNKNYEIAKKDLLLNDKKKSILVNELYRKRGIEYDKKKELKKNEKIKNNKEIKKDRGLNIGDGF